MTDPADALPTPPAPPQEEDEKNAARVGPSVPCVETAGSTAERHRGVVTAAEWIAQLQARVEKHLDWIQAESFIVQFPNNGKKYHGGYGAVVDHSTAMHALLFIKADLKGVMPSDESMQLPNGVGGNREAGVSSPWQSADAGVTHPAKNTSPAPAVERPPQEEVPLTEDEQRLAELVRAAVGDRPFRPFVHYDEATNETELLVRDCSVCEGRENSDGVKLLTDNYHEQNVVGVRVKGKLVGLAEREAAAPAVPPHEKMHEENQSRVAPSVPCVVGQDLPQRGQRGTVTAKELANAAYRVIRTILIFNERQQVLSCPVCSPPKYPERLHESDCPIYQLHDLSDRAWESRSADGDAQQSALSAAAPDKPGRDSEPGIGAQVLHDGGDDSRGLSSARQAGSEPADSLAPAVERIAPQTEDLLARLEDFERTLRFGSPPALAQIAAGLINEARQEVVGLTTRLAALQEQNEQLHAANEEARIAFGVASRACDGNAEAADRYKSKAEQLATRLAALEQGLSDIQRHRDHWRGYAYGVRDKPQDFLDGNMVDPRPMTFLEINAQKLAAAEARVAALGQSVEQLRDRWRQSASTRVRTVAAERTERQCADELDALLQVGVAALERARDAKGKSE